MLVLDGMGWQGMGCDGLDFLCCAEQGWVWAGLFWAVQCSVSVSAPQHWLNRCAEGEGVGQGRCCCALLPGSPQVPLTNGAAQLVAFMGTL